MHAEGECVPGDVDLAVDKMRQAGVSFVKAAARGICLKIFAAAIG
jgi:hypothetical protein